MTPKNSLLGEVLVTRFTSNDDAMPTGINIKFRDCASGVQVEATLSLEQYALATTSAWGQGTIAWNHLDRIGKAREHKIEVVPIEGIPIYPAAAKKAAIEVALTPFEVEGWVGSRSDMVNGHCSTPAGQRVSFVRYV